MSEFFGDESVVIPDLPAPIVAYRAWSWDSSTKRLTGFGGARWKRKKATVAEHRGSVWSFDSVRSRPPCVECPSGSSDGHDGYGCGIYGFDTVEQLAAHAQTSNRLVWGQVELGGTVYEHAHGYRASHASVKAIYRVPSAPVARLAAKRYAVDLIDFPLTQAEIDKLRAEAEPAAATISFSSTFGSPISTSWFTPGYSIQGPAMGSTVLASASGGTCGCPECVAERTDALGLPSDALWTPPADGGSSDG